jgi:hypothetical protein
MNSSARGRRARATRGGASREQKPRRDPSARWTPRLLREARCVSGGKFLTTIASDGSSVGPYTPFGGNEPQLCPLSQFDIVAGDGLHALPVGK